MTNSKPPKTKPSTSGRVGTSVTTDPKREQNRYRDNAKPRLSKETIEAPVDRGRDFFAKYGWRHG